MQTDLIETDYRPEIDGLRALAVIPVIFFHAGLMLLGRFCRCRRIFRHQRLSDHHHNPKRKTRGQFSLLVFTSAELVEFYLRYF